MGDGVDVHCDDSTTQGSAVEKEDISVALGEGQIPSNILTEPDWDVKTFHYLFLDGNFRPHHQHEQKLSPIQYLNKECLAKTDVFLQHLDS